MKPHKGGRPTPADKLALLERRKRVGSAWIKGAAQWEIARVEGVDQAQISRDLKWIHETWLAGIKGEHERHVMREVGKLNAVEAEAWAEWERSKRDAETRQAKTVKTAAGERTEASKREEGQCGDPRFLAQVCACVRQRCELLGLLVQKHEHGGKDGGPIEYIEVRRVAAADRGTDEG